MTRPTDPYDPFETDRHGKGVADGRVGDDEFLAVLRYEDLRAVARDWSTFSSDAPFRVPIPSEHDLRPVRQLPIETNPPDHTEYRAIVKDVFSRSAARAIRPRVQLIADALLDVGLADGRLEVVRSYALPLQSRSLALLLRRSQEEAAEWISWGTHVFRDRESSEEGHATDLDRYLDRAVTEALEDPGDDFFGLLATAEFRGRALRREEMVGFANLVFAGGRDTVIHSIANALEHLARHPEAFRRLKADPALLPTAVEEFVRYFSPLTHIGRVVATPTELGGRTLRPDDLVSLCFASANRDGAAFDRPDECVLDREPNRHVGFGYGPHFCLGAPLARVVTATALERVLTRTSGLRVLDAAENIEDLGWVRRRLGFEQLEVGFLPAEPTEGAPIGDGRGASTTGKDDAWDGSTDPR